MSHVAAVFAKIVLPILVSIILFCNVRCAIAQVTEADVAALKMQSEAQVLRKTIAEAERAEFLAKLPPTESKALPGTINSEGFGAAANVRAFDLAQDLAREVCINLPETGVSIYNASIVTGIVNARILDQNLDFLTERLAAHTAELRNLSVDRSRFDDRSALLGSSAVVAGIKTIADITSLFKTDITVTSKTYGEDTRELFVSALAEACKEKIKGLGSGYSGELNATAKLQVLDGKINTLIATRSAFNTSIAETLAKAEKSSGAFKQRLTTDVATATSLLKVVDAFIVSLKIGELGEQNPVYSAARYLTYDARTSSMPILDFKLNLEGIAIKKTNIFTGQHMRLSGVAYLWYRLQNPDGTLVQSKTLRRLSRPVQVDLRGKNAPNDFFDDD